MGGKPDRFSEVAHRYDDFFRTPIGAFVESVEREALFTCLRAKPGERWLDLGCGTGRLALSLSQLGAVVVGVDASEAMLAEARAKQEVAGAITWLRAELEALPLPTGAFDGALLNLVLEFVDEPERVLAEAGRVVRPGGRIVVGILAADGAWARLYRRRASGEAGSVWTFARFWRPAELIALVGRPPECMVAALYVAPEECKDSETAWHLERQRSSAPELYEPGFVALSWLRT